MHDISDALVCCAVHDVWSWLIYDMWCMTYDRELHNHFRYFCETCICDWCCQWLGMYVTLYIIYLCVLWDTYLWYFLSPQFMLCLLLLILNCESESPPTARQRGWWNLAGVFSMPLVEGDLSNQFGPRDLSCVSWKNKAVETLIAQARLAAVRCVCEIVHT